MTDSRLRVILCTNGGLHGALVLGRLLHAPHVQVVGLVRSSRAVRASYGFWRGAYEHVRLSGVAYALYLWCSTSLADMMLGSTSTGALARRQHIPVHTTRNANDAASLAFAGQCSPDLLVSAFFNQRIHVPLTTLPRYGAVNIHPSLLPAFRGVDPVFFGRLRQSSESGVSVHRMDVELDAGNILCRETVPPGGDESVFAATAKRYDRGAQLLVDALPAIGAGAPGTPQPPGETYDSWPTSAQVRALRAQRIKLVQPRDLWNLLRARPQHDAA